MPQLHLYVPERLADEIRRRAQEEGLSVSRFLARIVRAQVADEWPEDFFDDVVGGWSGDPLRRPRQPDLESRDDLEPRRSPS